jgi:hypothetical protein
MQKHKIAVFSLNGSAVEEQSTCGYAFDSSNPVFSRQNCFFNGEFTRSIALL